MNKKVLILISIFLISIIGGCSSGEKAQGEEKKVTPDPSKDEVKTPTKTNEGEVKKTNTKVITMIAEKFKFTPSTITVKKGDEVEIIIKSIDVKHSLSIPAFGVNIDAVPDKKNSAKFVASKAGTFDMVCEVFCGSGHDDMKATLIVEE
tara:strand:+ start:2576 stop:3022 length:447 start_codon:yes stop_codon:yes gene_type:complete